MTSSTRIEMLKTLHRTIRRGVEDDGFYLVYSSNQKHNLNRLVTKLGGHIESYRIIGAALRGNGSKPFRTFFTIGRNENLYLLGSINLSEYKEAVAS